MSQECELSEMERAAYQRGDVELAEILGRLIYTEKDAADELQQAQEEASAASAKSERLMENVSDAVEQLMQLHDAQPDNRPTKAQFEALLTKLEAIRTYLDDAHKREEE